MWARLSSRQRRVLIGLGLANAVLLIAVGALALAPAPNPASSEPATLPDPHNTCRTTAARALAERGVAGTIAIRAGDSIDFRLSGDDPAAAWSALAAAADLPARGCGPYDPIRIDVPDPSLAPNLRLVVEARWTDVLAWSQGRLDDSALSERMARSTYVQAVSPD
jgi:hypothetical protein